jgi:site-specific recombinase XerD
VTSSSSSWDKGVDYESAYSRILRKIERVKSKTTKCYLIIALIQLRNGSRISEAVRAFKEWIRTNKTEIYVRVSKKKREETRLMIIPSEIAHYRLQCVDMLDIDNKVLRNRVLATLYYYFKINTHSLRYAFITHLLRNNVNPAIVSKIIKHSKLETLLHYVQVKESERVLRDLV